MWHAVCLQLDFRSQYDSFNEKKQVLQDISHKLTAPVRILVNHESVISQLKMLVYPVRNDSFDTYQVIIDWCELLSCGCPAPSQPVQLPQGDIP